MENEREQPEAQRPPEQGNVRYLDEWRAQHQRYYSAKTAALRGRRRRMKDRHRTEASAHHGHDYGAYQSLYGYDPPHAPVHRGRHPGRTGTGSLPGQHLTKVSRPANRWWAWAIWCVPLFVGVAVWLLVTGPDPSPVAPPAAPTPSVVTLWAPWTAGGDAELQALLRSFEETHGVTVRWQARPIDPYELFHGVMAGGAPDVILVDHETSLRLMGMNALLPLVNPTEGEPDQYVLPLAEDTFWARAMRAAIPRQSAHPELARALVAHLATAASSIATGSMP